MENGDFDLYQSRQYHHNFYISACKTFCRLTAFFICRRKQKQNSYRKVKLGSPGNCLNTTAPGIFYQSVTGAVTSNFHSIWGSIHFRSGLDFTFSYI